MQYRLGMSDLSSFRISWIGTGVMGQSMCGHLLAGGARVALFTRTRDKAQPLLDRGAVWADSPRAAAEQADVVFTMVGFPADVRAVYFSADGVLAGVRPGVVLVDMTTTEPSLAIQISEAATGRGAVALDAPVSGGDVGAKNATLSIMVGGDAGAVNRVRPLLEAMGRTIVHEGGPGFRPAHQDVQPNRDRGDDDRGLREPALRRARRARISTRCWRRFAVAPPAAGRSRTLRRAC